MIAPVLRRASGPADLAVTAELGAGLLVLTGLEPGSQLLRPDAHQVTGAISRLLVRPAVGLELPLTRALALVASASVSWSPTSSDYFADAALTRFDLGAGASVRF